ncbi:MAG: hypothetical protein ACKOPK_03005, partial [Dolichospermum sp.]
IKNIFSVLVWWFVGGKTTKSDSRANATQEVNVTKKLNNTNPKSFFMDNTRVFGVGTVAKWGR